MVDRTVLLFLATSTLVSLGAAPALAAIHPLTLQLDTDSDWAHVDLCGLQVRVLTRTLTVVGDTAVQGVGLDVHKAAGDTTPASVRVTYAVAPTGEPLELVLTRGDVGATRVRVWAGPKLLLDVRQEGVLPDRIANRVAVPLPTDKILATTLPRTDYGRKVLAFYYGWYGTPTGPSGRWLHWDPQAVGHASTHEPLAGYYDSLDPGVVAQHVAWARATGIDGFVLSWWPNDAHHAAALDRLLQAVAGTDFQVSLYLEAVTSGEDLRSQIDDLTKRYGKHPNWLRVRGRPVLFAYGRVTSGLTKTDLQRALRDAPAFVVGETVFNELVPVLDGVHTYVYSIESERYQQQLLAQRGEALLWDRLQCATVIPGYDDTNLRKPGGRVRRDEGRLYQRTWATAALADWVLITTWNEWHEGTEIEPSREDGDRWLNRTRAAIRAWRGEL